MVICFEHKTIIKMQNGLINAFEAIGVCFPFISLSYLALPKIYYDEFIYGSSATYKEALRPIVWPDRGSNLQIHVPGVLVLTNEPSGTSELSSAWKLNERQGFLIACIITVDLTFAMNLINVPLRSVLFRKTLSFARQFVIFKYWSIQCQILVPNLWDHQTMPLFYKMKKRVTL